jgi:hypothetical protein
MDIKMEETDGDLTVQMEIASILTAYPPLKKR